MGGSVGKLHQAQVLILGLDGAGKTSLVTKKKGLPITGIIPTVGFTVDKFKLKNVKLNVWDVGGQDSIRPLWKHYYSSVEMLIFVIDATDIARMSLAKDELYKIISDQSMVSVKILVVVNKMDMDGAKSIDEINTLLDLKSLKDREWKIIGTSAVTGSGIDTLFKLINDWLTESKKRKISINQFLIKSTSNI